MGQIIGNVNINHTSIVVPGIHFLLIFECKIPTVFERFGP
jgi:hypothetical protein